MTAVVRWCFRLKAVRGGLVNSTCDRDDSIICQLPAGTQRTASLLLHWVPVRFWLEFPKASKREQSCFGCCLSRINCCSACWTPICISCLSFFFFFSLFILALLPWAFMFSYKKFLSVNSNYPPFLSMNQSFGYPICFSKPSKQLWLWCWPRFTVLLKQYVVLCLGFFRIGLWMYSQFSHSLFSQVCMPVCYKCYMVWVY